MATKSVARTRIGPFRQLSSVIRRFVAPWYCWNASQAEPLREPIEPAADRQAADDRPEVAAALGQIAFRGPDVGMQADGREVEVVGRPPGVDPRRHHPVADQSLRHPRRRSRRIPVRSGRLGRTIVSWYWLWAGSHLVALDDER